MGLGDSFPLMRKLYALLFCLGYLNYADAAPLLIAADTNLHACLLLISEQWTEQHAQIPLDISSASSGNLSNQIQNDAPFAVFLSADEEYPKQLIAAGAGVEDNLLNFADVELVVWSRAPLTEKKRMDALLSLPYIALANPSVSPFGQRALQWLNKQKPNWQALQPRLLYGDNVAQVAQLASNDSVPAAFIAKPQSRFMPLLGKGFVYPLPHLPTLKQTAILTKLGKNNPDAIAFIHFLESPRAQTIWQTCAYLPPL